MGRPPRSRPEAAPTMVKWFRCRRRFSTRRRRLRRHRLRPTAGCLRSRAWQRSVRRSPLERIMDQQSAELRVPVAARQRADLGRDGQRHVITAAEAGHQLTCRVTATNGAGSAAAVSGAVVPSMMASPPVVQLRVNRGTATPDRRCCSTRRARALLVRRSATTVLVRRGGQRPMLRVKPVIAAVFSGAGHLPRPSWRLRLMERARPRRRAYDQLEVGRTGNRAYLLGVRGNASSHAPVTGITHNHVQCRRRLRSARGSATSWAATRRQPTRARFHAPRVS